MKKIIFLISVLLAPISNSAEVLGYPNMLNIYQKYIAKDQSKKPPMPKLYVYDNLDKKFINNDQVASALELTVEGYQRVSHFLGKELKDSESILFADDTLTKKFSSRYQLFYFNLPEDAFGAALPYHPTIKSDHQYLLDLAEQKDNVDLYLMF